MSSVCGQRRVLKRPDANQGFPMCSKVDYKFGLVIASLMDEFEMRSNI